MRIKTNWSNPELKNLAVELTEMSGNPVKVSKKDGLWRWECVSCGTKSPYRYPNKMSAICTYENRHKCLCS